MRDLQDAQKEGAEAYRLEEQAIARANEVREKWLDLSEAERGEIEAKLAIRDREKQKLAELQRAEEQRVAAAEKAQEKLRAQAEEAARAAQQPFINAASSIQSAFADTFTDIFAGGVDSFSDLADAVKGIFFRLAGELAAVNLFGDLFQQIGKGGATVGSSVASGGAGILGGVNNVFSNLATTAVGQFIGDSVIGELSTTIATSIAPELFGAGAVEAGTGLVAGGGSLAAAAPFALPVLAAVAIPLIAGLFKKKPSNKEGNAIVDFADFGISVGGQEGEKYSQENRDAAQGIAASLAQIAAAFETISGSDLAGSLRVGVGNRDDIYAEFGTGSDNTAFGFGNDTRISYERSEAGIAQLVQETALRMADELREQFPPAVQAALDRIDFTAETALSDLNFAANFTDLYGLSAETIGPVTAAFKALEAQADQFRQTAERLGLSIEEVNRQTDAANDRLGSGVLEAIDAEITAITDPVQAALNALRAEFDARRSDLQNAGLDTSGLDRLQQLREQQILASQIAEAEQARAQSMSEQLVLIQSDIAAQQQLAAAARAVVESVRGIQNARLLGAGSPLSAAQQYQLAQDQLADIERRLSNGETVTAAELQQAAQQFDAINLSLYGLSETGTQGFDRVSRLLERAQGVASSELERAERSLSELQRQSDTLQLILEALQNGAANSNVPSGYTIPSSFNLGANAAFNAQLVAAAPDIVKLAPGGFDSKGSVLNILDQLPAAQKAAVDALRAQYGFASGASLVIPGNGSGTDRVPVTFYGAPQERVTIETVAQQAGARMQAEAINQQARALSGLSNLPQIVVAANDRTVERLTTLIGIMTRIEQRLSA